LNPGVEELGVSEFDLGGSYGIHLIEELEIIALGLAVFRKFKIVFRC
jgi:hypothetical protein